MKHASRVGVCAAVVVGAALSGLMGVEHGHAEAKGPDIAPQAEVSRPVLAVVGASISDGVGAGNPDRAYPALLAAQLGWQSMVSADPGAGYVALGSRKLGPMLRLLAKLQLTDHKPTMVIVQAGYNDIGKSPKVLASSVSKVIGEIRTQAPDAAVGVLTVFPKGQPSPAAWATDTIIVDAARNADPHVYIFDPLTSHWVFPTLADRLHPTAVGHRWIADRLAADFRHDGLTGLTHH
ncbi:SGNH/GDSL hydrolase family protein [Nocardia alni]|uniref:SGNH/GDSL hydrolase family protein n=1 Tax=Nocardia alni TaxID=2815723 RepID=UPI001C249BB0|nr:SGNH/GDSL hydrolase family protein [Nocardia alni]